MKRKPLKKKRARRPAVVRPAVDPHWDEFFLSVYGKFEKAYERMDAQSARLDSVERRHESLLQIRSDVRGIIEQCRAQDRNEFGVLVNTLRDEVKALRGAVALAEKRIALMQSSRLGRMLGGGKVLVVEKKENEK